MPSQRPSTTTPARDPAFVAHVLELLAAVGRAHARRMFGGHGLYLDELFVAIVADERLYLKADAQTAPQFAAADGAPFSYDGKGKPMTMAYWTVPAEALESAAEMAPWARLAMAAALRAQASKPVKAAARAKKP
jgi:DNA transformation protein and related proteins